MLHVFPWPVEEVGMVVTSTYFGHENLQDVKGWYLIW